jgi:hypothetical protein
MKLADPASSILMAVKPEATEKDKQDNLKTLEEAKKERLKIWKRPTTKKEQDDARAERKADWEAKR